MQSSSPMSRMSVRTKKSLLGAALADPSNTGTSREPPAVSRESERIDRKASVGDVAKKTPRLSTGRCACRRPNREVLAAVAGAQGAETRAESRRKCPGSKLRCAIVNYD